MAASAVAGVADPHTPLPPNAPPPSSVGLRSSAKQRLPHLEPPTAKSEGEHLQNKLALPPTRSERGSDFLPPELLQTLKEQQRRRASVGAEPALREGNQPPPPPSISKRAQSPKKDGESILPAVRPPANVWSHPKRFSRFTHLTTHPPCVCGAGRDISFLYDVSEDHKASRKKGTGPKTLIPEEYHLTKHPGVLGLEFHQDQYTTQSQAHDNHVTTFPSMNPGGRYEVIALKNTMEQMLEKAGVPREVEDANLHGPTQIHNLLDLVKKEQAIYNICFHELIRQVSVQCAERGELLQDIRRRYSQLLDRIPRQVMSLHNEVLAQRTLDRRLTAEIQRFQSRMTSITDRLAEVKDHDTVVIEQSKQAYEELSSALTESEKSANQLAEYHSLYELQRKRMEEHIGQLVQERDVWQGAAYGLAGQVAKAQQLRTLRRLQLGEKAWAKVARHFTTLLSEGDTQQLSEISGCVGEWRKGIVRVSERLGEAERDMQNRISEMEEGMQSWCKEVRGIATADGRVVPLGRERVRRLWEELRSWLVVLNRESEAFSGDALLSRLESLQALSKLVERWTEVALEVLSRHQEMKRFDHAPSDHAHSPEHQTMLSLSSEIDITTKNCTTRLSGENGVAVGFIHLITPLETWDAKLNLFLNSSKKIPDSDWIKLGTLLGEWLGQVQRIRACIGTVSSSTEDLTHCTPMSELAVEAEKWRSALTHSISTRDCKIDDMVSEIHSALVLWMVLLLLTSTHTAEEAVVGSGEGGEGQGEGNKERGEERDTEPEERSSSDEETQEVTEREPEEEEDSWERGMGLTAVMSADLEAEYASLADSLTKFTTSLTKSTAGLVEREVSRKREDGHTAPDEEKRWLELLGREAEQWVQQAALLLRAVGEGAEGRGQTRDRGSAKTSDVGETGKPRGEQGEEEGGKLPKEMQVIKEDLNIHAKPLQQVIDETPQTIPPTPAELGLCTEQDIPEGRAYLKRDTEALVIRLDQTKGKLKEQEELTQQALQRAEAAERELESSRAQLSEIEAELRQTQVSLEQARELGARSTRGGKGGGGRRGRGGTGGSSSRK